MKKNIVGMLLSVVLVGCGANDLLSYDSNDVSYSFTDTLHTLEIDERHTLVDGQVETGISLSEVIMDNDIYLDIVELGEIIIQSMSFWHEVLYLRGRFSQEHLGHYSEVWDFPQHKPILRAYQRVLPTSGFESLQDIKDYLLQFYTESFLESVFSLELAPFIEYDNTLYLHTARIWFASSKLETAIYTLVEHNNDYSIVEMSVLRTVWDMLPNLVYRGDREELFREAREQILRGDTFFPQDYSLEIVMVETFYHFTFVDNRINDIVVVSYGREFQWDTWWV
ncbi:MAG: hypothetical protein FWF57_03255 [Defluviitaleaceae bacterium]|nr:hypothetical protein [Defluviitaleaceae bacterium]